MYFNIIFYIPDLLNNVLLKDKMILKILILYFYLINIYLIIYNKTRLSVS